MKPKVMAENAPFGDGELISEDLSQFLLRAERTIGEFLRPIEAYISGADTPAKKKFKRQADEIRKAIAGIEARWREGKTIPPVRLIRLGIELAKLETASRTLSGQGKGGSHKSGLFLHTMRALDAYYAEAGRDAPKPQWTQVLAKMDPNQVKGVGTKSYFFWKDHRGKWNKITDAAFRNNLTKWPREIESF